MATTFSSTGWAAGASVSAHLAPTNPGVTTLPAATQTVTASGAGVASFTGLAEGTHYIATDGTRRVYFQTDAADAGGGGTGPAGPAGPAGANLVDYNAVDDGEETVPRVSAASTSTMSTGVLRFAYFTARKTESISQVRLFVSTQQAAPTPSLVRIGIYTVDLPTGDLTLVASTPNDTTLLATASTAYTKALSAALAKVAGTRYAVGLLVVTASTAPTIVAAAIPSLGSLTPPAIASALSAQSNLPTPITGASLAVTGTMLRFVLLP